MKPSAGEEHEHARTFRVTERKRREPLKREKLCAAFPVCIQEMEWRLLWVSVIAVTFGTESPLFDRRTFFETENEDSLVKPSAL